MLVTGTATSLTVSSEIRYCTVIMDSLLPEARLEEFTVVFNVTTDTAGQELVECLVIVGDEQLAGVLRLLRISDRVLTSLDKK